LWARDGNIRGLGREILNEKTGQKLVVAKCNTMQHVVIDLLHDVVSYNTMLNNIEC